MPNLVGSWILYNSENISGFLIDLINVWWWKQSLSCLNCSFISVIVLAGKASFCDARLMKIYGEVVTFWTRHGYHVVPLIALNTSTRLIHSQPGRQMALIARREIPPAGGNIECRLHHCHGLKTCCVFNWCKRGYCCLKDEKERNFILWFIKFSSLN